MKYIITLICLIPGLLFAQSLSLQEIWDIALKNNNSLSSKRINYEIKSLNLISKKSNNYPKIFLKANANYLSDISTIKIGPLSKDIGTHEKYDFNLTLQQNIWTGNRVKNEILYAEQEILSSGTEFKLNSEQIKYQSAVLYYQIKMLDKHIAIISQSIERLDNQLQRIKNLYKAKQVLAQDTLDISNKKLELLTQETEILYQRPVLLAQLKQIMNIDYNFDLKDEMLEQSHFEELNYYQAKALVQREEFKKLKFESDKIDKQIQIVKSVLLPQIFAQAELHYANPGLQMQAEWGDYYALGIGFSLNLWDWKDTANKEKQLKYTIRQLDNEKNQLELNIKTETEQLYWQIKSYQKQYSTGLQLVDQESLRYQLMKSRFENSQISSLDLLDVESKVREATHKLEQVIINLKLSEYKMKYLCGNTGE